ncbi:fimbria/pilus periplasmic chaperone [Serratia marcescens]|uniref:fimbria/pilus periplasmic chaperone n=1 Tax=Serratia marcescens TaxID=615 RepID=UPI0012AC54CD|nr:fimbria/pilus periplasmic chaperone [Serratia marcescens]
MKLSKYSLLAILFFSCGASASVTLAGTRIVYEEDKKEANISVTNQDHNSPVAYSNLGRKFSRLKIKKRLHLLSLRHYLDWNQNRIILSESFILEEICHNIRNRYIG